MKENLLELVELIKKGTETAIEALPGLANAYVQYKVIWLSTLIGILVVLLLVTVTLTVRFWRSAIREEAEKNSVGDCTQAGTIITSALTVVLTIATCCIVPVSLKDLIHAKVSPATFLYQDLIKGGS